MHARACDAYACSSPEIKKNLSEAAEALHNSPAGKHLTRQACRNMAWYGYASLVDDEKAPHIEQAKLNMGAPFRVRNDFGEFEKKELHDDLPLSELVRGIAPAAPVLPVAWQDIFIPTRQQQDLDPIFSEVMGRKV